MLIGAPAPAGVRSCSGAGVRRFFIFAGREFATTITDQREEPGGKASATSTAYSEVADSGTAAGGEAGASGRALPCVSCAFRDWDQFCFEKTTTHFPCSCLRSLERSDRTRPDPLQEAIQDCLRTEGQGRGAASSNATDYDAAAEGDGDEQQPTCDFLYCRFHDCGTRKRFPSCDFRVRKASLARVTDANIEADAEEPVELALGYTAADGDLIPEYVPDVNLDPYPEKRSSDPKLVHHQRKKGDHAEILVNHDREAEEPEVDLRRIFRLCPVWEFPLRGSRSRNRDTTGLDGDDSGRGDDIAEQEKLERAAAQECREEREHERAESESTWLNLEEAMDWVLAETTADHEEHDVDVLEVVGDADAEQERQARIDEARRIADADVETQAKGRQRCYIVFTSGDYHFRYNDRKSWGPPRRCIVVFGFISCHGRCKQRQSQAQDELTDAPEHACVPIYHLIGHAKVWDYRKERCRALSWPDPLHPKFSPTWWRCSHRTKMIAIGLLAQKRRAHGVGEKRWNSNTIVSCGRAATCSQR
eukprot:g5201.t1